MDLKMYILVNKDIPINKGKLAGQVGHAVASYFYKNRNNEYFNSIIGQYMKAQKKIVLYASQSLLEELEHKYITIRDNGITDLVPNTLTCVNIGIIDYDNFPEDLKWLKRLRLCR